MAKHEIKDGLGIIPDGETTIANMAFSYCEEEVRKKGRREGNFLKIKILFGGISKFKKFGGEEEENFNI